MNLPVARALEFARQGYSVLYVDTDLDRLKEARDNGLHIMNASSLISSCMSHYQIVVASGVELFHPGWKTDWLAIATEKAIVVP